MIRKEFIWSDGRAWLIFLTIVLCFVAYGEGHGRLIEPPSRASAWRYGFQTPPDYNDHELYCGGFTRQWKRNGGKCGECGDAWDMPEPRPHENGGQWGQGVIVRSYLPGTEITIRVELTASHMGYFEFRICPKPSAKQACLDENLLRIISGSPSQPSPTDLDTRFYPRNGSRIYDMKAQLPAGILCNQCVLQWRYIAGNNWGMCDDGVGAVGCGPQEEFRSCSDIAITADARIPHRPIRPTIRVTTPSKSDQAEVESEQFSPVILLLCILLLLGFIGIGIWIIYKFYRIQIREWTKALLQKLCTKQQHENSSKKHLSHTKVFTPIVSIADMEKGGETLPPIPPPRTKRDTRIKEMSDLS
ncbi:hypothetical protein KR222_002951 [Zaprionus bogoriensis]|nr:hypothetical protein KR222_002951 [Zaprionus bogoriensis]